MTTTRRRRINAHREQIRAQQAQRQRAEHARVERMERFDDALVKLMAGAFVVLCVLISISLIVT